MRHSLVDLLFEEMKTRGITLQMMARMSRVSSQCLQGWKYKGIKNPSIHTVERCWNALGYDVVLVKRKPNLKLVRR